MSEVKIPKLRFKADNNSNFDDWQYKKLGDLLKYEQPTKYLVSSVKYDNSYKTPVLTAGKTFIKGYTNETNGIFCKELPVIIFDDFTTAIQYVDFPFKAKSSAMKILKIQNKDSSIKLIYECMKIINFSADDHKRYWISQYQQLDIKLPQIEEQIKIANFLSAVDKKIEQLNTKKALFEKHKKGVMQQIFSQKIRFNNDNGNNFDDWQYKNLGDIAINKNSNISANKLQNNNGNYPIYGAAGYLKSVDFYTEKYSYIAIVKDGAGVGRIMLLNAKTSVLGTLTIIKTKKGGNIIFLYWLIQIINFSKYVVGGTIPHIYYKDYQSENLQIPEAEEQTKIANLLSVIDKKISFLTQQIDFAGDFKKSLMQKMFV